MIKQLNTTKLAASTCHKAINKPNHVQHKNNADFSFFFVSNVTIKEQLHNIVIS